MASDEEKPKRGLDWVTPPVHPNIGEILDLLGFKRPFDDETVRTALKELLELRKAVPQAVLPPGHC